MSARRALGIAYRRACDVSCAAFADDRHQSAVVCNMSMAVETEWKYEDALARQCVDGDISRLGDLIQSLKRVVFSALIAAGVPAPSLDDCFQATALRIIEKIGTWRGDGRIASWAYAVARSAARDFLRAVRDLPLEPDDAEFLQNRRSESPPIDDSLIDARRREFLRCVVAELPDVLSEAAVLFYYGGMKAEDIAATLDTPLNTVKSRLLRARAALIERAINEGWRVKGVRTNGR